MTPLIMAAVIQWQFPHMLAAALLACAGIVAAVLLLYPAQARSLPAFWRWCLPGLRCLALLAVAASLARPVAQRVLSEPEPGAYVILVDNSHSMATVDNQRSRASLVALADGLGLLQPNLRTRAEDFLAVQTQIQRLPTLVETITQARVELDYAELQARDNPDAQKRFNEAVAEFRRLTQALAREREKFARTSKSFAEALEALRQLPEVTRQDWQQRAQRAIGTLTARADQFQNEADEELYRTNADVRQACDALSHLSRFQLVEKALTHPTAGLLSAIPQDAPLYGYAIAASPQPVALRGDGQNVRRLLVTPDAPASNLTGGSREVLDRLRSQKIHAAFLFSDGRQVGEEAVIATSLAGGGVPVHTVLTAPADAPVRDAAISRIEMPSPPNVFAGETLNAAAHVVWSGVQQPQEVALHVGNYQFRSPVEPLEKSADNPNANRGVARFSVQFDEPGPTKVTFSIKPDRRELTQANNTVHRWIKILSDRFDVLLVGGAPSWDFRHLRGTLSRTRWVNLRTALLDADDAKLDLAPEQIASHDVIILCDAPAKALSPEQWDAVRRSIARRGASAILIAGPSHLPREYASGVLVEFLPHKRPTALSQLPRAWRTWPGDEPEFRFVPAPGLSPADLDVLALADDYSDSWYRWNGLPPVFRYLPVPEIKESAQALLVERDTHTPVLTRHRLGRGKVFFLGIEETWRWRSRSGDKDQERFFRQLVRAAADQPYAVTNEILSLDADQLVIRPGEPVRVRAKVVDPGSETWAWNTPAPATHIDLEILANNSVVRTQPLPAVGEPGSGRFEGQIWGLDPGQYTLRLRAPFAHGLEYPLQVAPNYEQELQNLAPDPDLLRRLSKSSGGLFKTLENFDDLPKHLEQSRQLAPRIAELRLWDSWYLYAVVLSALTAEWALRKRFGLA
jgi:hypothetical protein